MSDESGQDKTEDPTGKRLGDSRKKGQIARSRELNTFVTLMISSALLVYKGQAIAHELLEMMVRRFQLSRDAIFDPATPVISLQNAFFDGFLAVIPIIAILLITDLLLPLLMGGWNFTTEAFAPNFSKLNPISGIKKIIGIQGFVELVKAIIKTLLVGFVAWSLCKFYMNDFLALSSLPVDRAISHSGEIMVYGLLILSATFLLLVIIDVPYQLWHHHEQLKMTKQEVREEHKQMEGSPEVKNKVRSMQMQAARRRMMEAVPKADVIVTNPTHFAVALKYDLNSSGAPILVAKGTDLVAAQIRNLALAADVTLVAAPSLARALYYSTELDHEIPRGLFLAVAQVLAYVFQLKAAKSNGWIKPVPPVDVPVPDEFKK